ncbi:MAG: tetratricopeptide repeat protein [Verrucomicrobiae bacterium]|nr:tetratricopeptide repeat protein [Verrucomicrobiae bacterium]MDW7979520.1 tetratricopeptide repeat protein [Verrucomicrobiales bacterium]
MADTNKPTTAGQPAPQAQAGTLARSKPAPLFRPTDWATFAITTVLVWIGYYLTLAPDLTLEDSGELATASFYAGIPHPPGYPVWTIYTWFWTLLPWGNVAWRVGLGCATAGALACGLLALLVSRGSSMLMEGLEDLKNMRGGWENAICMAAGFVSGMLLGFNGYMWSQSVIVEVYSFSVLSLMGVLVCLLRWIYSPNQRRYLYLAMFIFGICFTNHQTLVVAAMGIEVAIAAADWRLGRNLFLGNSILYGMGLIAKGQGLLPTFESPPDQINMVFFIFNMVGVASIAAYVWFAILTKEDLPELARDACLAAAGLLFMASYTGGGPVRFLGVLALCSWAGLTWKTRKLGLEQLAVILMGLLWLAGAAFYLYMPISGMSTPPMQWGYPRTVEGFFHALTRGQYEKANPTNFLTDPGRFFMQLWMLIKGVGDEFNWVYTVIGLVPFLYFFKMQRRERAWLTGIVAIYLCLGVLLMILLNPSPERASRELVRVFFTASHVLIALLVGYGLTIIAAYMATHYQRFRPMGLIGGGVAVALAIFELLADTQEVYFGGAITGLTELIAQIGRAFTKDQYGLPVYANLLLIAMALIFLGALLAYRSRAPLAITLGLFALMPSNSIMTHWADNEQRGHLFGYWFGHDMFTPPFVGPDGKLTYDPVLREQALKGPNGHLVYPEMSKHAVLYGGTDPGRFCPTYMIFCESFIPPRCKPHDPNFDRRDVYLITQNALADHTYLCYLRSQYNRSKQIDPPFFQELLRSKKEKRDNYYTNILARMVIPLDRLFANLGEKIEKRRRTFTSWFKPEHFIDLPGFVAKLRPHPEQDPLSKFLFDNLSKETQQLLTGAGDAAALKQALARDLNVLLERELIAQRQIRRKVREIARLEEQIFTKGDSPKLQKRKQQLDAEIKALAQIGPLYESNRFAHVTLSDHVAKFLKQQLEIEQEQRAKPEIDFPYNSARIRLNRLLLEEAYPAHIAKSLGGVYPDREIYIATPEDASLCFSNYLIDAQQRLARNELKPGEDVRIVEDGGVQKVQVAGQVAVMSINALIAGIIFTNTPDHEFYIEESFPLDWMYPFLTPYGIIMKINREPLPELSEEILQRDHHFWSHYSERLIGNWITYDTPLSNIVAFVEKVYLRKDFSGFKGDRKFVRDDQAQKAFSKLRSAIAGVYTWRIFNAAKSIPEQQRLIREAEFAFKQAFAFCPYSPEAVFRYAQLLVALNRIEDALLIARTCLKLDPYNGAVSTLVKNLEEALARSNLARPTPLGGIEQLEAQIKNNPNDFQAALDLAALHLQLGQTNRALEVLDSIRTNPAANIRVMEVLAQAFAQIGQLDRLEPVLETLANNQPGYPEAWYNLAAIKAVRQKPAEAISALAKALHYNALRLATNPHTRNLTNEALRDERFNYLRGTPEFRRLLGPP